MRVGPHADLLHDVFGVRALAREPVGRLEERRQMRRYEIAEFGLRRRHGESKPFMTTNTPERAFGNGQPAAASRLEPTGEIDVPDAQLGPAGKHVGTAALEPARQRRAALGRYLERGAEPAVEQRKLQRVVLPLDDPIARRGA